MNPIIKYAALGLGGASLFAGTYVGIAAGSGAPLHEVAGINWFVDPPQDAEPGAPQPAVTRGTSPTDAPSGQELLEANAGMLGAFMLESPFNGTELRKLENELRMQVRKSTVERERLQVRGLELDEREQSLRERQAELAEQRTKLEDLENSIDLRMAELVADETIHAEQQLQGWRDMAKLYAGGDARANALMLAEESPADAALILRELKAQQAAEILREINPASERKKFMDAYRLAGGESPR
jgi:hypothetical protein